MVILGLGSNLGDRAAHLRAAIGRLSSVLSDVRVSQMVESPALMPPDAPKEWNRPYVNMAISGKTILSPQALFTEIKAIEAQLGRMPGERWAPRVIDIDILAMEGVALNTEQLHIPHAGLFDRDFALLPLAELTPEWDFSGQHAIDIAKDKKFLLPIWRETSIVGIVNITPDSFSDRGQTFDAKVALDHIAKLIQDGADIIDIGAESTRPGATPVSPEEEWSRLSPVLSELKQFSNTAFSLDTRHALVAKKALEHGIGWINDVSGFASKDMVDTVKDSYCKLVVMHSLSVPTDKNIVLPPDADVIETLLDFAQARFSELEHAGIERDRLIFDPGIGFGKTAEQSRRIIDECARLKPLGVPLFFGHSRKSFLGEGDRDQATLDVSRQLARQGIEYLRVHDVAAHKLMLKSL